ncbi:MAG: hypothetical protein J0H43_01135, partial [Actinobacteria bacterium]|nr:hypothetical protein [Actinomycetota bacterium]
LGFVHAGKELTAHEPTAVEESATSNTETAQAQPGAPTDAAAASTAREPQEEAAPNPPLTGEALQQAVATLDRIEPAYKPWTPSAAGLATEDEEYVGKHRKPGGRTLSLLRMFYTPRHRAN